MTTFRSDSANLSEVNDWHSLIETLTKGRSAQFNQSVVIKFVLLLYEVHLLETCASGRGSHPCSVTEPEATGVPGWQTGAKTMCH